MKFIMTDHAKERMELRNISFRQVLEAFENGATQCDPKGRLFVRTFVSGNLFPLHVGFDAKPCKKHGFIITLITVVFDDHGEGGCGRPI
jgi:hypothetical protein